MSIYEARVKSVEDFLSLGIAGSHSAAIDRPLATGGTDAGFRPAELMLLSLGGCLNSTLAGVAKARELTLSNVEIRVTGKTQPNPERFSDFEVEIALTVTDAQGAILNEAEVDKLIQIAERGCFITNTLKVGANVTVKRV